MFEYNIRYHATNCLYRISHNASKRFVAFFMTIMSAIVPCIAQIDAEMVTYMGRNALSVDDYLTAIHYFNQAIESKPFLAAPYYYRAYAKFTLEDYRGAETDCDKSINLNPFQMEVYQLRALCRIHNNDFTGAVDDYTRVLKNKPKDQNSRYNRSLCYLQLKDYKQANKDLDYMMRTWPNYYRPYMVRAQSLLEQKDTVSALVWIDKLLEKNPRDGNAWGFKGQYALSKKHYTEADSCLTHAISYTPNDYELYISRAQARHALGKFGLAIADYDQTIALQPTHFVAHYNRGLLRTFVGDLNNAILDFDYIIQVEPSNTLAIYNRAELRTKVGNYKGAIADYTKLIRSYPNFYYGYLMRAQLRRKIGDVKGALNDETVVARHNLDVTFGHTNKVSRKNVRLRSDHELDKYQQLVQEDPDTARNVFGTFFGKVQNEQVSDDLAPMFAPAFCHTSERGYHSVGFMAEMVHYKHAEVPNRKYRLTAEHETNSAANAEYDEKRVERVSNACSLIELHLYRSSIALAKYNYTTALSEASNAISCDSSSVVALLQRANVLYHMTNSDNTDKGRKKELLKLALTDLKSASTILPDNAYVQYNIGCMLAMLQRYDEALEAFTAALKLDNHLTEAYYNRAILYKRKNMKQQAIEDFSKSGQLGYYKAYAQIKQIK